MLCAAPMRMKSGLPIALLLVGCGTPAAERAPERVIEPRPAGAVARGDGLLRAAMIAGHAAVRDRFGSPPLTWDITLAADASRYARTLAERGQFAHSTGSRGAEPEGENLWTGTRAAYRYDEMVGHWAAEAVMFRSGVMPAVSTTGRWQDVGHYTQMVWPTTTRFGCALASNRTGDYLVCRYALPGNVVGRRL